MGILHEEILEESKSSLDGTKVVMDWLKEETKKDEKLDEDSVFKIPLLTTQMKSSNAGCLDEKYFKATSHDNSSAPPLDFLLGSTFGDETKEDLESFKLDQVEGPLDSCNSFYSGALSGRSTSIGKLLEEFRAVVILLNRVLHY